MQTGRDTGCVGPSVCMDCYEVSEEVIDKFREAFDKENWDQLFYKKANGKYQLNLRKANELIFLESGIRQSIWRLQMCVRTATVRSFILIVRWEISVVISVHFLH